MHYRYATRREGRLALDYNEYVGDLHPGLLDSLSRRPDVIRSYPALGTCSLEAEIGRHLALDAEQVILTNGADDAIFHALLALNRRGLRSFAPFESPTYDHLHGFCACLGIRQAAVEDAELIYVCTPNNPTGTVLEPEAIRRMVDSNPERSWIIDVTYADYCDHDLSSYVDALRRTPNACVVTSFGKALPMAGVRLGMIVTWDRELHEYFDLHYNRKLPNHVARHLMRDMLCHLSFYEEQRWQIRRNRQRVREAVLDLFQRMRTSTRIHAPDPEGGNFVTFFGENHVLQDLSQSLDRARVAVRHKAEHAYLRVTSFSDSYLDVFERRLSRLKEGSHGPVAHGDVSTNHAPPERSSHRGPEPSCPTSGLKLPD